MKFVTFPSASKLAGLAIMLELMGHNTEDYLIAQGMEAPFAFVKDEKGYKAGAALYTPDRMNLYLHPLGFHIMEELVPGESIISYLRTTTPSMMLLNMGKDTVQPVVCTGYSNNKFTFISIKAQHAAIPDTFTLTTPTLKRRMTESTSILTLKQCEPEQVDLLTPLEQSLDSLKVYLQDITRPFKSILSQEEFLIVRETLLRPLMQDLLPLANMMKDSMLAYELILLNHDYRHILPCNKHGDIMLCEQLPLQSIRRSINWFREIILDRMTDLGATDESINSYIKLNWK